MRLQGLIILPLPELLTNLLEIKVLSNEYKNCALLMNYPND